MSNFLNMCTYLENTLINISNARFTLNKHAFFLLVGGGREGIGNVNGSMFAHCLTVLLFAFADSLNRNNVGYSCGLQSRCPLPRCRSSFIDIYTISCSQ
jgi:hypothetical protein